MEKGKKVRWGGKEREGMKGKISECLGI